MTLEPLTFPYRFYSAALGPGETVAITQQSGNAGWISYISQIGSNPGIGEDSGQGTVALNDVVIAECNITFAEFIIEPTPLIFIPISDVDTLNISNTSGFSTYYVVVAGYIYGIQT